MNLKQLNVLLLGLAFHLIFFSFQTSVFVQQTVVNSLISRPDSHFQGNAYVSLCITYTVFALSNWLAPSMIALTGVKYGMILGASTYVLYSASFLWPNTWLFYAAAALIGFGAAPLWTGQGAFLAKQSDSSTSSKNAAIFWSMLQSSLLFGNLFVYFAFSEHNGDFGGTKTNAPESENQQAAAGKISDLTRYIVYGVLTIVCTLGMMVLLLLRDGSNAEMSSLRRSSEEATATSATSVDLSDLEAPTSAVEQFLSAIKLSKTTNMLLLSTAFLFTGQLLSFFTGVYGTAIGATSQFGDNAKRFIGLAGIAIGVGEIFGGTIFGIIGSRGLGDKLRRDTVFVLGFFMLASALALTFVNLPPDSPLAKQYANSSPIIEPRLWISMLASVMIGFGDACFNTQIYSMLMSVYQQNSVPAFALFKFTQSIGSAIAFLYSTRLDLYSQIIILAAMSTLATVCFCLVEWSTSAKKSSLEISKSGGKQMETDKCSPFSRIEKSESRQSILYRVD